MVVYGLLATEVSLAVYTDRFKEAWDPENGIEEEYWPDKDEMVCWRTMRAAMKASVNNLDLAVKGTGALVKGILGLDTNDASKESTDDSASTLKSGGTENDTVKKEQNEENESDREVSKESSPGIKRERSDSLKRAQNGDEPPVKRERMGRIRVHNDDIEVRVQCDYP